MLNFKNLEQFKNLENFKTSMASIVSRVSSETLGWVTVLVLHASTIPTLLAVMNGLTDRMPPLDLVLMVWTALTLMFVRAAVQKDMLNLVTIGLGFVVQAVLLALIFFK